ncbi:hypothetical protein EMIHUDRAFT_258732, partial [Emiliania huxleyi CCMP1516]|uniref:CUB domain-containing protein n=2 Tax=Emiliania huxleyi TaxID=2903 RepID=A0A0D3I6E5_EMIH1
MHGSPGCIIWRYLVRRHQRGDDDPDLDYDGNGDPTDDCPYDYLVVNGVKYCGTSGPTGVVALDGNITWVSDYSVDGPCPLTDGAACATSPNYPDKYGPYERCEFTNVPPNPLVSLAFDVEPGADCSYDYLVVNGVRYCGISGPSGVVPLDGNLTWVSDHSVDGPCPLTDGGACATSPHYPDKYGPEEWCEFTNVPPNPLVSLTFDVQGDYSPYNDYDGNGDPTDDCYYDYLIVNGV